MVGKSQDKLKDTLQEAKLHINDLKSHREKYNNPSETSSSTSQATPSGLTGLKNLAECIDNLLNDPTRTIIDTDIYIIKTLIELFIENDVLKKNCEELQKIHEDMEQNLNKINRYIFHDEHQNYHTSLNKSFHKNKNIISFFEQEISSDEEDGKVDPQIERNFKERSSRHTESNRQRNFLQFLHSGLSRYQGKIYDTKSIHMCAITVAFKCALQPSIWRRVRSWIMTFMSLLTIFLQVLLLFPLINEITRSNCVMHSDCRNGLFCNGIDTMATWRQPRCYDCSLIKWDEACPINITLPSWASDVEQYTQNMWFDADFTPHVDMSSNVLVNSTASNKDLELRCLAAQYCKTSTLPGMSTISKSTCPFLKLHLSKRSNDQILSFLFVSILFGSSLSFDLKESEIENTLLDFAISSLQSQGKDILYSTYFIRLTNRMRRYVLPFLTTSAGAAIIISDEFSSKNILLNLISILFINEADNLLGLLFLPPWHDAIADELVKSATRDGILLKPVWRINLYALVMSIMMFAICTSIQPLVHLLYPSNNCFGITDSIYFVQFIFPGLSLMIGRVLLIIIFDKSPHKIAKGCLELTRMAAAYALFMVFLSSVYYILSPTAFYFYPQIYIFASILASIGAGIRPSFILKYSIKRSLNNYLIDTIIIACWVGTQYWVMSNLIMRLFNDSNNGDFLPPFHIAT